VGGGIVVQAATIVVIVECGMAEIVAVGAAVVVAVEVEATVVVVVGVEAAIVVAVGFGIVVVVDLLAEAQEAVGLAVECWTPHSIYY
jgi:hypothetical protein